MQRFGVFLLIWSGLLFTNVALAQSDSKVTYNPSANTYTVVAKQNSVHGILNKIQQQSGVRVVTSNLEHDATTTCDLNQLPLETVLGRILPRGTRYHIIWNRTGDVKLPVTQVAKKEGHERTDVDTRRLPTKEQKLTYNSTLPAKATPERLQFADTTRLKGDDRLTKRPPESYKGISGKGAKKAIDTVPGSYAVVTIAFRDTSFRVESIDRVQGVLTERTGSRGPFVYALQRGESVIWLGSTVNPLETYSTGNNREHVDVPVRNGSFSIKLPAEMFDREFLRSASIGFFVATDDQSLQDNFDKNRFKELRRTLKPVAVIRGSEMLTVKSN